MFILDKAQQRLIVGYAAITILALASGAGSLFGDFVFDDTEAIVNNKDVWGDANISNILQNDFWGTKLTHNLSHKSYRPLTVLSFRLNYLIFGKLVSWGFHLVNVVLHVIVSLSLVSFYLKILPTKIDLCLLGACLFAVHPIHTEAVSGIVGRADLLAALFFIYSFLSFTKCASGGLISGVWLFISCLLAALAMFCKEHGVTVLGFNLAYELIAIQRLDIKSIFRQKTVKLNSINKSSALRCCSLIFAGFGLVWFRCFLMDFKSPTFQPVDNPASFADDWQSRVLTLQYIVSLNGWLLLCPDWLCFDWSMGCLPLIGSFIEPRVFLSLIFWLLLAALFTAGLRSPSYSGQREILMSLTLISLPFLPASNLLFRVGFVVAERVLYIPSAGFCLLVVIGKEKLVQLLKKDLNFAFGLLLMVFLLKSHHRSLEWRTETSLFNSALSVCPLNAKVRYNVAKSAADRGLDEKAIAEYREAIRLYPEYDQALNNLANLLKNRGELHEAEKLLKRALKVRTDFPAAWMNLGIVLASRKAFVESDKAYLNALKLRKNYPDCYYNMGNLYLEQQRYDDAEKSWLQATKQNPNMVIAWNNLIALKDNQGNHTAAVEMAETAIKIAGAAASFHFNMANALGKISRYSEAEKHFKLALQSEPYNALYHVNLGVLYHRWKKYEQAEKSYLNALRINPKLKSAKQNYSMLKKVLAQGNG